MHPIYEKKFSVLQQFSSHSPGVPQFAGGYHKINNVRYRRVHHSRVNYNTVYYIGCGKSLTSNKKLYPIIRQLFNIRLHMEVLHQVYITKQYEHIEQI